MTCLGPFLFGNENKWLLARQDNLPIPDNWTEIFSSPEYIVQNGGITLNTEKVKCSEIFRSKLSSIQTFYKITFGKKCCEQIKTWKALCLYHRIRITQESLAGQPVTTAIACFQALGSWRRAKREKNERTKARKSFFVVYLPTLFLRPSPATESLQPASTADNAQYFLLVASFTGSLIFFTYYAIMDHNY